MDDAEQLFGAVPKNATEEVRVSLSEFQGRTYINVRTYADVGGDEFRPTKKGFVLGVNRLPALAALVQRALDEAERRGLIGGGE